MNFIKLMSIIVVSAIVMTSCKKVAKIDVINQNNCNYNFFKGGSTNGEYLGVVNANDTKTFEITLERGLFTNVFDEGQEFFANPTNCTGFSSETFFVYLEKRSTAQVLID